MSPLSRLESPHRHSRAKRALLSVGLLAFSSMAATAQLNWISADVGTPAFKGSVTDNGNGTFTMQGGGNDIWGNASNFHFYYAWASGQQWDTSVQIQSFSGPDTWSKVELMVSWSDPILGPQGADPFIAVMGTQPSSVIPPDGTAGGQNVFGVDQFRSVRAGAADWLQVGASPVPNYPNAWMKLHRNGSIFSVYYSTDGVTWTDYLDIDTSKTTVVGGGGTTFGTAWPDLVAVGVAITAHNDTWVDPGTGLAAGSTATIAHLTATFPPVQPPTTLTPVVQVQNATAIAGGEATFSFTTTNNATPPVVLPTYQWYKNNTLLAGATGTALTWLATTADNGAHVYCTASIPAPYNTTIASLNSATGTLSVASGTIYTNGLKTEFWANTTATTTDVEAGNVPPASRIIKRPDFDDPGGYGNNYDSRVSGFFIPPTTDHYVFFLSSDDNSDLYLSTDSDPAHKTLIAQQTGWDNMDSWFSGNGGSGVPAQKRSDQFSPDNGVTVPGAGGYSLTAGNLYYIEAVHHQGGGGDSLGVTYQTMSQMNDLSWSIVFTNGVPSLLQTTNHNIALISYPATTLTWVTQPTNTTVAQGLSGSFYASTASDSEFVRSYQWYRGGAPIAGATSSSLLVQNLTTTDNGAQFFVVASTALGELSITSSVATLTVSSPVVERGWAKVEYWYSFNNKTTVTNGTAPAPDYTISSPAFEAASTSGTAGNNYVNRLSALFYPPTTGNYVFFINTDDAGDLFVSTDSTAANKQLVAQEAQWSNPWQWLNDVGSTTTVAPQKRSDQWSPDGGVTVPYASGIHMVAGQPYYIELVHQDTGGGNNAEATFKLVTDPDPANGTHSKLTGNLISMNVPRAFTMAFSQQPANASVPFGGNASFTAQGATDSQVAVGSTGDPRPLWTNFVVYQWTKNGTAIPGATGSSYAFGPVSPLDNGAQFACQIRSLGYVNNSLVDIWSNSVPATLNVTGQAVYEPGFALYKFWALNPGRAAVENLQAGDPTFVMGAPAYEADRNNFADNFTDAMFGYFVPAQTGSYIFFNNSDDDSDLFLSTDSSAGNARLIAQETAYASPLAWGASGGTLTQVRSDTFVDPATGTTPYASGIPLVAGTKYYMAQIHHEGGGGNQMAVTCMLTTDPAPASGSESILRGSLIGAYVPACSYVAFTNQPQSLTVNNYQPATFTAGGVTDSRTSIDNEYSPFTGTNTFLLYQWFRNGVAIAGASASQYVLSSPLPSDNGANFMCQMRALGLADGSGNAVWSNSVTATLSIITNAPHLLYSSFYMNSNWIPVLGVPENDITLVFDSPMDPVLLSQISTYTLGGGLTISSVTVSSNDFRRVTLAVSGTPTFPLSVTVNSSLAGVGGGLRLANTTVLVVQAPLVCLDIGVAGIDPAYPGRMYMAGPNDYTIACEGSDIWNNADGFNFTYEIKTNDFDVVVRQKDITHTSNWAKGGLMVRETLDAGSRNWNIINDPLSSDGIPAPDGSGNGANAIECNARISLNGATATWAFTNGVPAYPNAWVRLTRKGSLLSAYWSQDGVNWTLGGTNNPALVGDMTALPAAVYVGICTTAHNNDPYGTPADQLKYLNVVDYANYNSSYVPAIVLTATRSGGNILITWTPPTGHLVSSPVANAPAASWQAVAGGTGGSATVPLSGGAQFFRVVNP